MEFKEIASKSVSELNHLLSEEKKKLDNLNFKAAQNQLKNVREIREVKLVIARILTVLKTRLAPEIKEQQQ